MHMLTPVQSYDTFLNKGPARSLVEVFVIYQRDLSSLQLSNYTLPTAWGQTELQNEVEAAGQGHD
jgi:hypothetical protein